MPLLWRGCLSVWPRSPAKWWPLLSLLIPLTFPISLLLDRILGSGHGTFFRRAELKELVKMHGTTHDNEDPLSLDEVLVLKGALDMRYKTVGDSMTPLESVYMIEVTRCIDWNMMKELLEKGHSRIPVFRGSRDDICGMLIVKKLIQLDPEDSTPIRTLDGSQTPPPSCLTTTPLYHQLNLFQTGRSHLSLVYKEGKDSTDLELVGIITLEDVIEELIGEEIVDETDQYVDVHRRIAVARARLVNIRHSASAPAETQKELRPRHFKKHPKLLTVRTLSQPDTSPPYPSLAGKPALSQAQRGADPAAATSTDASGGGLDLETVYKSATPISGDSSLSQVELQDDIDESEEAPLIIN